MNPQEASEYTFSPEGRVTSISYTKPLPLADGRVEANSKYGVKKAKDKFGLLAFFNYQTAV